MSSWQNDVACYLKAANDKQVCRCDDVNGDGTNVVEFVQVWRDGAVLENYTDETCSTVYVPSDPANIVDCCDIGTEGQPVWRREVITNTTIPWVSPPTASSLTYMAVGAGATIDDGTGPEPLFEGESGGWGNSDFELPSNQIQITADAATSVVVVYKLVN